MNKRRIFSVSDRFPYPCLDDLHHDHLCRPEMIKEEVNRTLRVNHTFRAELIRMSEDGVTVIGRLMNW